MKLAIFIAGFMLIAICQTFGQHCPFDGASGILLDVDWKSGKSNEGTYTFTLEEKQGKSGKCKTKLKADTIIFLPYKDAMTQTDWYKKYYLREFEDLRSRADLFCILSTDDISCFVSKKATTLTYKNMQIVAYNSKTKKRKYFNLPAEYIYLLCRNFSRDRIKTLTISL